MANADEPSRRQGSPFEGWSRQDHIDYRSGVTARRHKRQSVARGEVRKAREEKTMPKFIEPPSPEN